MNDQNNIPADSSLPGGLPAVDNSNVTPSEPVNTSSAPRPEATAQKPEAQPQQPEAPAGNEPKPGEQTPPSGDTTGQPAEQPPAPAQPQAPAAPKLTLEDIQRLSDASQYQPGDEDLDITDEYGNLDPQKFSAFMQQNNAKVFDQAVNAVSARGKAQEIETSAWENVHNDFPEVKDNETLGRAIRGARIQDLLAGGDGDIHRLAQEIVGPIRDGKIKAVEDVNRQVTEQKKLETFTPDTPTTSEKPPVNLMSELRSAVDSGDRARATQIRHAIRRARIYGTNNSTKQ